MSNPSFRVEGSAALTRALAQMGEEITREVGIEIEYTGQEMRTEIIRKYNNGPASGVVYELKNPNRTHQSSVPGEYPMADQGALAAGTLFKKVGPLAVEVYNEVVYAVPLEYGSRGQGARPAWQDTVDETQPEFLRAIEAAIAKGMR
jgi:hypothetical protein